MHLIRSFGHVFGGTLLIAATTIGVGMLALPVATAQGGFYPSLIVYLACWTFMLCTGLLFLEICTWLPEGSNLLTMAQHLLGNTGKRICWIVYLFLLGTVMIAHVTGGGLVLSEITAGRLPVWFAMILYVLIFAPVVYLGTHSVDRLNIALMAGLAISYLLFIYVSYSSVDLQLLKRAHWTQAWWGLPILFTAFAYQLIIPTLMSYMQRNTRRVRQVILLGTSIPFIVYVVWQFLILGIVPVQDLVAAGSRGENAVAPLKALVGKPLVYSIGTAFSFFTLTASFIALSLAYVDFLADGLKMQKVGGKKVVLCLLVFLPPLILALVYPHAFLRALRYAGGFSIAILFGLYPPLMAWVGRYSLRYPKHTQQLAGGKTALLLLIFFALTEIVLEIVQEVR